MVASVLRCALAASLLVAVLALGKATYAGQIHGWEGDFESGNLSQWDSVQQFAAGRVTLEHKTVRQGRYAARFEIRPGDHWAGLVGGERAEVLKGMGETAGQESYWAWSTYFPKSFVSDPTAGFQMFTQWHSSSNTNVSGVSFQVVKERLAVRVAGGTNPLAWKPYDLGPLIRGAWQDFVVHVRWSSGDDGVFDVWRNGQAVAHATGPNIGPGLGTYVKQGFYRPPEPTTTVIFDDAMRYGTSLDQVTGPFDLQFAGKTHRAKGRIWFHLRSFASTPVSVTLTDRRGQKLGAQAVQTNGSGDAWSSIACAGSCVKGHGRLRLLAAAAVDPNLPQAAKSTETSVR